MNKKILIAIFSVGAILVLSGIGYGGYYVYKNYYLSDVDEDASLEDGDDLELVPLQEDDEEEDSDIGNAVVYEIPELSLSTSYDDTVCSWETFGTSDGSTTPANVSDLVYEVTCSVNTIEGTGKIIINPIMTGGGYGLFAIDMVGGLYYEENDAMLDQDSYIDSEALQISDQAWTKRIFEYSGPIGYFNEVWYYPEDPDYSMMEGFDWNGFSVIMGYEIKITTSYSDDDVTQIQGALDQVFEGLN